MAAKSNYFKESGFHTWRFHYVGKRKPPLAASACRPRGPALTKSSHATCCKSFASICGTFGFISLRPATHSNPSRFKAHASTHDITWQRGSLETITFGRLVETNFS